MKKIPKGIIIVMHLVLLTCATSCSFIKLCPTYSGSSADKDSYKLRAKMYSKMEKRVFAK